MNAQRLFAVVLVLAAAIVAAGPARAGEQPAAPPAPDGKTLDADAVRRALELRVGHDVHDASTNLFVHEVFGELGVPVDGLVADLQRNGQTVQGEPQAGDLVFYPGFVAIADGQGMIYPSGTPGRPQFRTIVKRPIEGWYKDNMSGVRSFFDAPNVAVAPPAPPVEEPQQPAATDPSVDHTATCTVPDCPQCAGAFDDVMQLPDAATPDLPPVATEPGLPLPPPAVDPLPAPAPAPELLSKDEATRRLARALEKFQRGLSPQERAELQRRLGQTFTEDQARQLVSRFGAGLRQPDVAAVGNDLIEKLRVPGPDPAPVDLAELIARQIAERDGIVPQRKGGMSGSLRGLLDQR